MVPCMRIPSQKWFAVREKFGDVCPNHQVCLDCLPLQVLGGQRRSCSAEAETHWDGLHVKWRWSESRLPNSEVWCREGQGRPWSPQPCGLGLDEDASLHRRIALNEKPLWEVTIQIAPAAGRGSNCPVSRPSLGLQIYAHVASSLI